ncbi:MAG: S1 RNA-binding domain-containing protein, partial [Actinomycetota bacterium]|nr:S1 RNA-binding domain-containing protein [Actinomycetota bacterium]
MPPPARRPPQVQRVVVDGSNLATEGRNLPSLAQLDEAVQSFAAERPGDEIIVVVDASFGYRIDESERKVFEEAEEAGEIVSPPAGAIGRGDGFLLRIADRIDATVLSNDSFQEFHGEYLWLFEEGRLIGGKPVPGVGWIFTPRTPVRGPKSRVATRDADRARRRSAATVAQPEPVAEAIAEATAEAIAPDAPKTAKRSGSRRRSRGGGSAATAGGVAASGVAESGPPEAINEPLPFITFIADHPLGTEVEGTVESFTSHGAFVTAGGARCYAPVSGLGDPPPRSAKEVLKRGDTHTFVIQALDPPRRGIELALPGLAKVAGAPTDETVEAEIDAGAHPSGEGEAEPEPEPAAVAKPRRSGRASAAAKAAAASAA